MKNLAYAAISIELIALAGWVFYLTGSVWSFLILVFVEYPNGGD